MTTINNLTIEQMREIVSGAPDWAVSVNLHNGMYYELREYKRGDTFLSELRQAIAKHEPKMHSHLTSSALQGDDTAKHDEFKVGDFVVYRKQCSLIWDGVYKVDAVLEDGRVIERDLPTPKEWLSHATPSEIKAGHRIDDTTDHVTDIRNHVSPSTKVVDL